MVTIHVKSLAWAKDFHDPSLDIAVSIGGVGSGKSMEAAAWLIERAIEFPHGRHYYMGAAYPAMREGTAETLCQRLDDYGFRYSFSRASLEIVITSGPAKGARFIPTSSEVYQRLKGQMIDTIWCDEGQTWCEGSDTQGGMAYDFILTRLRQSEAAQKHHPNLKPQLRLTANPPHRTSHWLYQKFVKRNAARLFHVTTFDNVLLPQREAYIERLREAMSPELFDIEVLGKWGNLGVGTVYVQFDQNKHVSAKAEYDPSKPLFLSNDFGVDPRVALVLQVVDGGPGEQRYVINVCDEFRIRNGSTDSLIQEFTERYPPAMVSSLVLYGDPAGQTRNSTTGVSDWQLMQTDPRLQAYRGQVKRKSAAPLVVDRVNAVNAKLCNAKGEVGIRVHPRCQHTIDDLQQTRWKDGTRQLDHGTPAKGILRTHLTDALGYFVDYEFPVVSNQLRVLGRGASLR